MSRYIFREYPEYTIEIEEDPNFILMHLPNIASIRIKRMGADLLALERLAIQSHKQLATAVPVDNRPMKRLLRALGMKETGQHFIPNEGMFAVFTLEG